MFLGLGLEDGLALAVLLLLGGGMGLAYLFFAPERLYKRLRPLRAFRRVEAGLALAMEEGQRLHYSLGRGHVLRPGGGVSWAALSVLEPLVRSALRGDAPPLVTAGDPAVTALARSGLRRACTRARVPEAFTPDGLLLTGFEPASYGVGAALSGQKSRQALTLTVGHLGWEAALMTDAAPRLVGGSDDPIGQAVLLATCDDAVLGEEVYAAGAYTRAHPLHAAALWAQDVLRWLLVLTLLGLGLVAALSRLAG